MGATTTIFSAIQNIVLDPFPYTDAHRVAAVQIHDMTSAQPGGRGAFQVPEFLEYQEQNHVFEDVIGGTGEDVLLSTGEGTELYVGGLVTANTFTFLGVPAVLGRTFTVADAAPSAPPVFVMADKMWLKQYSRDPKILGQTFILNGAPATLIGIMPRRFTKLGADLWRPVRLDRSNADDQPTLFHVPGAPQAWRDARPGSRGHGRHRAPPGPDLPGQLSQAVQRERHQLGRQHRRPVQNHAVHAGRGGRVAAPHRVQQRRQHAAHASDGA